MKSSVICCYVFKMEIVGYAEISSVYIRSVFFIRFFFVLILESSVELPPHPSVRFLEHGK